jgi:hypothetical protein
MAACCSQFGALVYSNFGSSNSSADWKFAAEQFVKRLPGKVFVHRECLDSVVWTTSFAL